MSITRDDHIAVSVNFVNIRACIIMIKLDVLTNEHNGISYIFRLGSLFKKNIFYILILLNFSTKSLANGFNAHVSGGVAWASFHNTDKLFLNSFVENAYSLSSTNKSTGIASIGFGYFMQKSLDFAINLGASAYYIHYDLSGINAPFINVGQFDTLNFHVRDTSYSVLFEPKLIYTHSEYIKPYIIGGLGISWNKLSNYSESPTYPADSAAPMPIPFSNKTTKQATYELGFGVQWLMYQTPSHDLVNMFCDYRWLHWGNMELGTTPLQTTSRGPELGTLNTQLINIGLEYQFT